MGWGGGGGRVELHSFNWSMMVCLTYVKPCNTKNKSASK